MAATHGSELSTTSVALPAPTAYPMALSVGVTLLFAGLLTHMAISILGAIVALAAATGWFREVLPHEQHETVPIEPEPAQPVAAARRQVARLQISELHRARLPIEIYPVSAGVKGGLAGSVAMAALAILYGLIFYRSPWYPINLLAGAVYGQGTTFSTEVIAAFHLTPFVIATVIHLVTSTLVGLLYGVMLPMFPRRPILLGGILAPVMWTGLDLRHSGSLEPGHERAHRLALVRRITVRIRDRGWDCRGAAHARSHVAAHALRRARWFRGGRYRSTSATGKGRSDDEDDDRSGVAGVCGARFFRLRELPGRPQPESVEVRPEAVKDFAELYSHNCSGCHGPEGKGGAALALANPVYLAITDEETLRRVTSTGVPGTAMPAFARQEGGTLTDEQINILVREIRGLWSRPDVLGGVTPPAYLTDAAGEPGRGGQVYQTFCASCHGPGGQRRTERQFHRRRDVPRIGERPEPSYHRYCRAAGSQPARLARLHCRPIPVEPGRVRRRGLAHFASASVSRPALSRRGKSTDLKVQR